MTPHSQICVCVKTSTFPLATFDMIMDHFSLMSYDTFMMEQQALGVTYTSTVMDLLVLDGEREGDGSIGVSLSAQIAGKDLKLTLLEGSS